MYIFFLYVFAFKRTPSYCFPWPTAEPLGGGLDEWDVMWVGTRPEATNSQGVPCAQLHYPGHQELQVNTLEFCVDS